MTHTAQTILDKLSENPRMTFPRTHTVGADNVTCSPVRYGTLGRRYEDNGFTHENSSATSLLDAIPKAQSFMMPSMSFIGLDVQVFLKYLIEGVFSYAPLRQVEVTEESGYHYAKLDRRYLQQVPGDSIIHEFKGIHVLGESLLRGGVGNMISRDRIDSMELNKIDIYQSRTQIWTTSQIAGTGSIINIEPLIRFKLDGENKMIPDEEGRLFSILVDTKRYLSRALGTFTEESVSTIVDDLPEILEEKFTFLEMKNKEDSYSFEWNMLWIQRQNHSTIGKIFTGFVANSIVNCSKEDLNDSSAKITVRYAIKNTPLPSEEDVPTTKIIAKYITAIKVKPDGSYRTHDIWQPNEDQTRTRVTIARGEISGDKTGVVNTNGVFTVRSVVVKDYNEKILVKNGKLRIKCEDLASILMITSKVNEYGDLFLVTNSYDKSTKIGHRIMSVHGKNSTARNLITSCVDTTQKGAVIVSSVGSASREELNHSALMYFTESHPTMYGRNFENYMARSFINTSYLTPNFQIEGNGTSLFTKFPLHFIYGIHTSSFLRSRGDYLHDLDMQDTWMKGEDDLQHSLLLFYRGIINITASQCVGTYNALINSTGEDLHINTKKLFEEASNSHERVRGGIVYGNIDDVRVKLVHKGSITLKRHKGEITEAINSITGFFDYAKSEEVTEYMFV